MIGDRVRQWRNRSGFKGGLGRLLGRRGTFLCLFGLIWLGASYGFLSTPMARFTTPEDTGLLSYLETPWAGLMWASGGIFAIVVGFLRRRMENRDEWGFIALLIPAMSWVMTYLWAWVTNLVSGGLYGRPNGWLSALVWSIAVMAILVVAGWPDPSDEPKREKV